MGFDSKGNLYVTTGDTNSSQGSDGYSGNNPSAKCPIGDNTVAVERELRHRELLLPGRAPDRGQHQRLQRQDAALPARCRRSRTGDSRPSARAATYTIPDDDRAQRPEPVQGRRAGARTAGDERPSPRSTRWACATRAASRSIPRPTSRTRPGSARTPAPERRPAARRRTRTPPRSRTPATTAGRTAWATSRPTATVSADGDPAHRQPGGLRARRPGHGRHRGLVRLRQPAQRLAEQHRPDRRSRTRPAPAPDAGKVRGNNLWYSRGNPGANNGCPDFPRPRGANAAPNYGATPTQLCPYAQRQRHDDHGRPGLPLRQGRGRPVQALARVLGRPLVPAQQRRRRRSSTACCWTRRPTRTAACRSTPTACATRCRGTGSYMDSKFGPDGALYVQTYDGFFRAGPNVGIYRYDYVGGASTPSAAPRAVADRRLQRPLLERAAPAASPTSGSSATARPRPRPTRRTPTPRPSATRPS